MNSSETKDCSVRKIVCAKCGAEYTRLPAFTCPRCGTPLCPSGCEGCTKSCAVKTQIETK
ncbi:MAG: hypothetical protein ACYC0V_15105 [Armatimonadota bacterium]